MVTKLRHRQLRTLYWQTAVAQCRAIVLGYDRYKPHTWYLVHTPATYPDTQRKMKEKETQNKKVKTIKQNKRKYTGRQSKSKDANTPKNQMNSKETTTGRRKYPAGPTVEPLSPPSIGSLSRTLPWR